MPISLPVMSTSRRDQLPVGTFDRASHSLGSSSAPARSASLRFISIRWAIDPREGLLASAAST